MLAERVEIEAHHLAVRPRYCLSFEVDRHYGVGALPGVVHQLVDGLLGQGDRQNAVLEAVVIKNVRKTRRNDAPDTKIEQRPWRVLATRPATKIVGADQDLGITVRRLVEHEIGIFRSVRPKADLLE